MMDYDLTSMDKRNTPCSIVIGMYKKIVSLKYRQHKKVFTDGSKQLAGVGAAAVVGDVVRRCSLPGIATILTAELMAIRLALNYAAELEPDKYLLCTDSLNAMICIIGL